MKKIPSTTEDIFVREMILHGKPVAAAKMAFPKMQDYYLKDAIAYMMADPEIRHRIDAGILYFYKDCFEDIEISEIAPVTTEEQQEFLYKIIRGERKYPMYVRTEQGLAMIMTQPEPAIVNDALYMAELLEEMEQDAVLKQPYRH